MQPAFHTHAYELAMDERSFQHYFELCESSSQINSSYVLLQRTIHIVGRDDAK